MREEHNVRYDFDILLVATILSEEEKAGLVNAHRGRFEPENNIEDMKTLVIDDEDIKTEPLVNCKLCDKTFCARVDLKNHMLNDHAKASSGARGATSSKCPNRNFDYPNRNSECPNRNYECPNRIKRRCFELRSCVEQRCWSCR